MLRYPPKRRASENSATGAKAGRSKSKALKVRVFPPPRPDPRLVHSGTPAISYMVAVMLFAGLMLCAHFTNSLPAPGDKLTVPAGYVPTTAARSVAPPHEVSAQVLGNVLGTSGPGCLLSEEALRADGGNFSILAHRPDGVVLSWAGAPPAASTPCPAGAPLLVSKSAYESLRDWRPSPSYER